MTRILTVGIDFWFDFISPYGYLASLRIDEIGARHGREVRWHPLLLGVTVLKVMGLKPLFQTPLKQDYSRREIGCHLRRHPAPLTRPLDAPPMNPLPGGRVFAWLLRHAPEQAKPFARQALRDYWDRGIGVDRPETLAAAAAAAGVEASLVERALADAQVSALLRAEVDAAVARGAFGSPFFIVDSEPFFGVDKLELIDEWLACGGW